MFFKRKNKNKWVEVNYHTGFYKMRYNSKFNIRGIPCLSQDGENNFIFYCETNLISIFDNKDLVSVKKL